MPFSKTFFNDVASAAGLLDDQNPTVRLEVPFHGFYVTLIEPEISPDKVEKVQFSDFAIEKEGHFFLVCENLMGSWS